VNVSRNGASRRISSNGERRNILIRSSHNGLSSGLNRKRDSPMSETGLENGHEITENEEMMEGDI